MFNNNKTGSDTNSHAELLIDKASEDLTELTTVNAK